VTPTNAGPGPLTLDDIAAPAAYERARDGFRRRITELKRRRRVALGPVVTLVFENVDTVRFQVHEMVRAERITTDRGIQAELDVYNALLPAVGELSATLFIELTSEEELRRWLPRLVGIERSVALELPGAAGGGDPVELVSCVPEAGHEEALTREEITAAVHYVRFPLTGDQVGRFAAGPVALVATHPAYHERTGLSEETRAELVADLRGEGEPIPLG
jgi:hypothetical protein